MNIEQPRTRRAQTISRSSIPRRILFLLFLCAASSLSQDTERVRVVKVVDGDTFEILKSDGTKEKVRLIGIDCPEASRNPKLGRDAGNDGRAASAILEAGRLATEYVRSVLRPGDEVRLEYDVRLRDRYRRLLAYVFLEDGRMLNRVLLEKSHASLMTMPPNVKYVEEFRAASRIGRDR